MDDALTERGPSLLRLATALKEWAEANLHPVETSRAAFDREARRTIGPVSP